MEMAAQRSEPLSADTPGVEFCPGWCLSASLVRLSISALVATPRPSPPGVNVSGRMGAAKHSCARSYTRAVLVASGILNSECWSGSFRVC